MLVSDGKLSCDYHVWAHQDIIYSVLDDLQLNRIHCVPCSDQHCLSPSSLISEVGGGIQCQYQENGGS